MTDFDIFMAGPCAEIVAQRDELSHRLAAERARAEAAEAELRDLKQEHVRVSQGRQNLSDMVADLHTGRTTETNYYRWLLTRYPEMLGAEVQP